MSVPGAQMEGQGRAGTAGCSGGSLSTPRTLLSAPGLGDQCAGAQHPQTGTDFGTNSSPRGNWEGP